MICKWKLIIIQAASRCVTWSSHTHAIMGGKGREVSLSAQRKHKFLNHDRLQGGAERAINVSSTTQKVNENCPVVPEESPKAARRGNCLKRVKCGLVIIT